jgi:manganese/iron transport system permease protein
VRAFLLDPFALPFMRRALEEVVILAVLGGVVGVHVLLRRLAFLSEALQHTVFPGIAIAFAIHGSLLVGAAAAAAVSIVLFTFIARRTDIDNDAALALLVASFFAVGVVVVSRGTGYQNDLAALLTGRILNVSQRQVIETVVIAIACLVALAALHKELVLRAFDPEQSAALGYPTWALDVVLNVVVALAVVAAFRAVGTVLVVAFVVTPAAAARLVTRTISGTMVVAIVLGAVCGWLGLATSYWASTRADPVRLASGATIVVTFTAGFVVLAAFAALRRSRTAEGACTT